jgi:hypothetical protein
MNQFNYFNYAQHLEQLKYLTVNESALVLEADSDPAKALRQVKSGANGGTFAPQWKQLTDAIGTAVDSGTKSGTVIVKHDEAIGGKDMVEVTWSVDASNNVTLSTASAANAGGKNSQTTSEVIKQTDIEKWADIFAGYTDVIGTERPETIRDIFTKLLTADFTKSLGRKAMWNEKEQDAIAALGAAFVKEEGLEDWPGDAIKKVNSIRHDDTLKAQLTAAIETVKYEFNKQWGMYRHNQQELKKQQASRLA